MNFRHSESKDDNSAIDEGPVNGNSAKDDVNQRNKSDVPRGRLETQVPYARCNQETGWT